MSSIIKFINDPRKVVTNMKCLPQELIERILIEAFPYINQEDWTDLYYKLINSFMNNYFQYKKFMLSKVEHKGMGGYKIEAIKKKFPEIEFETKVTYQVVRGEHTRRFHYTPFGKWYRNVDMTDYMAERYKAEIIEEERESRRIMDYFVKIVKQDKKDYNIVINYNELVGERTRCENGEGMRKRYKNKYVLVL